MEGRDGGKEEDLQDFKQARRDGQRRRGWTARRGTGGRIGEIREVGASGQRDWSIVQYLSIK